MWYFCFTRGSKITGAGASRGDVLEPGSGGEAAALVGPRRRRRRKEISRQFRGQPSAAQVEAFDLREADPLLDRRDGEQGGTVGDDVAAELLRGVSVRLEHIHGD